MKKVIEIKFYFDFLLQQRGALGFVAFSQKVAEITYRYIYCLVWQVVFAACYTQSKTNQSNIFPTHENLDELHQYFWLVQAKLL